MVTYVISLQMDGWNVHRLDDYVTETASGIASEEEALAIAMISAQANKPSEIIRVGKNGDSGVIAKFAE